MSLATRCVACGTIFRVVQDQLKVSEGWVRCGRCDEVFNALDGLFDLDREGPPPWSPPSTSTSDAPGDTASTMVIDPPRVPVEMHAAEVAPAHLDYLDRPAAETPLRDDPYFGPVEPAPAEPVAAHYFEADQAHVEHAPSHGLADHDRTDFADAELSADLLPDDERAAVLRAEVEADSPAAIFTPTPAFVARAERDARWRQPGRLAGVAASILLLVLMLGAQAAHHFRDDVAARWPGTRSALESWCSLAGCRLEAPRRIEDVVVENTGLTRAAEGTDTYRLAVTLHNRSGQPRSMPSIDLSLTDNSGQLVARRALAPADFQRPAATLAANADLPLQVLIATGSPRVSGYTVEIFYP